jgi:hypothetical protein
MKISRRFVPVIFADDSGMHRRKGAKLISDQSELIVEIK